MKAHPDLPATPEGYFWQVSERPLLDAESIHNDVWRVQVDLMRSEPMRSTKRVFGMFIHSSGAENNRSRAIELAKKIAHVREEFGVNYLGDLAGDHRGLA